MNAADLERYLHEHIPLSLAMAVTAEAVNDDAVVLRAPLAPNINHRHTVFGGSASALCILAAWSLVHVRLHAEGRASRLVIQRNSMEYLAPVQGDFGARATLADPQAWPRFVTLLERKGRARIEVHSTLEDGGNVAGRLTGEFVALS